MISMSLPHSHADALQRLLRANPLRQYGAAHPLLYFHPRQPLLFRQVLRFRHVPFQRRDFSVLDDPEPVVERKGHEAEHGFSIDRRWW